MPAYYNEFDHKTAAWLRELIKAGLIAPGDVDERSISDVRPDDLRGYAQCHFFAGIGGWSLALRLAGWPDDAPVWTGSCPCQPFSDAGKGLGEFDPRHLWPVWFPIIQECRPSVVFGEQVASKAALGWLDGVFADMEGKDYDCGASDLCAAGVGAPHIRQRLFWVADNAIQRRQRAQDPTEKTRWAFIENRCPVGRLADVQQSRLEKRRVNIGVCGEMGHPVKRESLKPSSSMGAWSDFDLIPCLDGKTRRVESGSFPLVARLLGGVVPSGDPSVQEAQATAEERVARLRGYGNSIVPQVAAEFIRAYAESIQEPKL